MYDAMERVGCHRRATTSFVKRRLAGIVAPRSAANGQNQPGDIGAIDNWTAAQSKMRLPAMARNGAKRLRDGGRVHN